MAALTLRPAAAQVARTDAAFQLVTMDQKDGEWRYFYTLRGPGRVGERFSDLELDVMSPRTPRPPVVTGSRGEYLFDGIARHYTARDVDFSHPRLWIGVPANWVAAIWRQGALVFSAHRDLSGTNFGVTGKRLLAGFELRSAALPALREYHAVPYRRPEAADGFDAKVENGVPVDSQWVVSVGLVLAPGWDPEIVTSDFLKEQILLGCQGIYVAQGQCGTYKRFLAPIAAAEQAAYRILLCRTTKVPDPTCARERAWSAAVTQAEGARLDRLYLAALRDFAAEVQRDRVSHPNVRFVLSTAVPALQRRLPSVRPLPPEALIAFGAR